jgi:hypothetical protein
MRRSRPICVGGLSPAEKSEEFGLPDRVSVYRRAYALGSFSETPAKREDALERIIEKAGEADVTTSGHASLREDIGSGRRSMGRRALSPEVNSFCASSSM